MKDVSADIETREEAVLRQPGELYEMWVTGGTVYRYTNGDVNVDYGGNTYYKTAITRGTISYNSKLEPIKVKISIPLTTDLMEYYAESITSQIVWVRILKFFRDDDPIEVQHLFVGRIGPVKTTLTMLEAECVGFEQALNHQIPRFRFQAPCNWSLFSTECGLTKSSYKTTTTVTKVDNRTYTSADFGALGSNYLRYGTMEWTDVDGNTQREMIVSHSSNTIKVALKNSHCPTGTSVDAYPGCDWKKTTCKTKYSNITNYGGHPNIPLENPAIRVGI